MRAYLLDYLLEELKDPRTNVYVECRCGLDKRHPSVADYFACTRTLGARGSKTERLGRARPAGPSVEVPRGVSRDSPTRGVGAGKLIGGPVAPICIAADAEGLYLLNSGGYVGWGPRQPLLQRTMINVESLAAFRGAGATRPVYNATGGNQRGGNDANINEVTGLVIQSPWIEKILAGEKTWEIRTRHATRRGANRADQE